MKHFVFAAVAVVLAGCDVPSQDSSAIRWKSETMSAGDFVTNLHDDRAAFTHVFRGRAGNGFLIETFSGTAPTGQPGLRSILDGDGNFLSVTFGGGQTTEYRPHDCSRTLGVCRYSEIPPSGPAMQRVRTTSATANGYQYQVTDSTGRVLSQGLIEIDERGMAVGGTVVDAFGQTFFEAVNVSYQ